MLLTFQSEVKFKLMDKNILLKAALEAGVKVFPKNFLEDNEIKVECLGRKEDNPLVAVFKIVEEGEFKGKEVNQEICD